MIFHSLKVSTDGDAIINTKKLCKALYKELKQTDNLYAEFNIVSEEEIQELNKTYRDVDKVTDVLSFPTLDGIRGEVLKKKNYPLDLTDDGKAIFIGSIAICKKRAEEQAEEYNHSIEREMTYLLCHGLLHLMGYDHMTKDDEEQMMGIADKIMNDIGVTR